MERSNSCTTCGAPTSRTTCGLCKFEAGREVAPEVVAQLVTEAEAIEMDRQREIDAARRRRYTVRTLRGHGPVVVVVAMAWGPTGPEGVTRA